MSENVYWWFTQGSKKGKRNRVHDCSCDRQPPILALFGFAALHISRYNVANTAGPQLSSPAAPKSMSFSSHLRCTRFRDKSDIK